MRLSGVVTSPSLKTFICWQLQHWVSWEGSRGKTHFTQDRWWWRAAGRFGLSPRASRFKGSLDSPNGQLFYSALKENDFFFLLHRASLLWEVGMRADNLSGLPGFRWLTDLVCFLHPERGTWVGGRVGRKNVWKDRSQVWSATEPLLCILPEGRNLVSRSLSKPCLFQTLRAQALWAHWWLPEMAVPRCCPLVHTANMPPASCGTFGTLVSGKCTVLTKNATLGEICYILFTKK